MDCPALATLPLTCAGFSLDTRAALHYKKVFGALPVESPRLSHCPCQAHATVSFSPLATLLPERTTPELLYLETKWAALMSYGLTVKLLQDVLPIDEPLEAVTIRHHVLTVAQRLEDALGKEQGSFIDKCPAEVAELPMPHGPLTVGIDGGYVKAQGGAGLFQSDRGQEPPRVSSRGRSPGARLQ